MPGTGEAIVLPPDLPSGALAEVWGMAVQRVSNYRPKGRRAKWYQRNAAHVTDSVYLAALAAEKARALAWNNQ